jgi:hypothetical protein
MRRYLVEANQTLEGEELQAELRRRIDSGPSSFYVLVPNTSAAHYHVIPVAGGHVPMPTMVTAYRPESDAEATAEARQRLDELLSALTAMGAEAEGHLGSAHPLKGIEEAFADREFDEVIVSILPRRVSRWLRADVPNQVERRYGVPVTTIITRR